MKLSFASDYNNGVHPALLKHLTETNGSQSESYGFDEWSESARAKIREACQAPEAYISFLTGGTQTNSTLLSAILKPYEGAICPMTGHIAVHEAGAVEITGHKVITLPAHDAKLDAGELERYLSDFFADPESEHCVWPGAVYISFPTEYGTIYSAAEISRIFEICRHYGLKLYIDGARLGYGLAAKGNDVTLPFLAAHCDCFYIGGTKVGALCGEALVFPKGDQPEHFFSMVKQRGALLAKSRLAGVQFDALFTDGLYFQIGAHAIEMAAELKEILSQAGFRFYNFSPTNQQFVIIPDKRVRELLPKVEFSVWGKYDEQSSICRFVTSWATTTEELSRLRGILL